VICEGATDFITLSHFLTSALQSHGFNCDFIDLQPGLDKTSERNCGWSNALLWLQRNSLKARKTSYLGAGLFSGSLSVKKCDCIIFLLDFDCLEDPGFIKFVSKRKPLPDTFTPDTEPTQALRQIMLAFLEISEEDLHAEDHICAISHHNSESWAIGVLESEDQCDVSEISKADTVAILLDALSKIPKSKGIEDGRKIKSRELRHDFCTAHTDKIDRLILRSRSFSDLLSSARDFF